MAKKHREALESKFTSRDLEKDLTFRQYFTTLLMTLWEEGEGFSGKRPFGNSGWEYDLFIGLCQAGLIKHEVDMEDTEYPEYYYDSGEAHAFVEGMLKEFCSAGPAATTASS